MSPAGVVLQADLLDDEWCDEETRVDAVAALVLQIDGGGADAPSLCFVQGEARDPLTVGRAGQLRVEGPGVLDVHAFVHFDGVGVFVCSTDAAKPVRLDGRPLPRSWTALIPGCKVHVGEVALVLRLALAPAHTAARAPPPEAPPPAARLEGDDVTCTAAPLVVLAEAPAQAAPPELAGASDLTHAGAGRRAREGSARRTVAAAGVAAVATWVAAIVVVLAVHHRRATSSPARAAASTPLPSQLASEPSAEPAVVTGAVAHPAPPCASAPPRPTTRPRGPSTQRLAADAMQAGDLPRALSLYEQLAAEQPDNPAFARAAAILAQRLASNAGPTLEAPR